MLEPQEGDVLAVEVPAALIELVVDLARTQQDPVDAVGVALVLVGQHVLEAALDQLVERTDRPGVAQQALGRHHDQRFSPPSQHLAAQQVEQLRRRAGHGHLDVVLGRQRQEPLQPGAGVFRALPLEPVRQQQDQAREALPLVFGAGDELVDDHLRGVGEVAELGLPDRQPVGRLQAVAVFETQDTRLGQWAVVDLDGRLIRRDVLQGDVTVPVDHVVQDCVAMAERAALDVLPRQPDADAVGGHRRQGGRLARRPVKRLLAPGHLAPGSHAALDLAVRVEILRQAGLCIEQALQPVPLHAGGYVLGVGGRPADVALPHPAQRLRLQRAVVVTCLGQFGFQPLGPLAGDLVGLFARDLVEFEQVFEVAFADALAVFDGLVEQRLGEARLVAFVVAAPPVAVHVDEHVAFERIAEVHRQADDLGDGLGVLAVDVEDRALEHLGDIGGVGARSALHGRRGKADLVVDDHVQRAADGVAVQLRQVQALLDDALAGEGGVAVDEQVHDSLAAGVAGVVLLAAGPADGDRVDEFEVAGVERQRQVNLFALRGVPVAAVAEVIFHVAAAPVDVVLDILELAEDLPGALAQDVGQHVEPPAMGHAQDDLVDALLAGLFHCQVE